MEFPDLVVNAGIRFDYIDNDDIRFVDDKTTPNVKEGVTNPSVDVSVDAGNPMYVATGIKKVKPFMAVSPRLGFSFPVTDRTVFHLQYGKFIQAPSLRTVSPAGQDKPEYGAVKTIIRIHPVTTSSRFGPRNTKLDSRSNSPTMLHLMLPASTRISKARFKLRESLQLLVLTRRGITHMSTVTLLRLKVLNSAYDCVESIESVFN